MCNSNSTHPVSTARTSPNSQKREASSPATSTSSRGSEDEDEREEKTREWNGEERMRMGEIMGGREEGDEGHSEGELGEEGCRPRNMTDEAEKSQLKEKANLQSRIAAMKNTLHEFQDLKPAYK